MKFYIWDDGEPGVGIFGDMTTVETELEFGSEELEDAKETLSKCFTELHGGFPVHVMTEKEYKKYAEYDITEPPSEKMPDDFEECGYCGFDHEYEYESARAWHEENDPNGELYK